MIEGWISLSELHLTFYKILSYYLIGLTKYYPAQHIISFNIIGSFTIPNEISASPLWLIDIIHLWQIMHIIDTKIFQ